MFPMGCSGPVANTAQPEQRLGVSRTFHPRQKGLEPSWHQGLGEVSRRALSAQHTLPGDGGRPSGDITPLPPADACSLTPSTPTPPQNSYLVPVQRHDRRPPSLT